MKKIFTLVCLTVIFSFNNLVTANDTDQDSIPHDALKPSGFVIGSFKKKDTTPVRIRLVCPRSITTSCWPLIILDGILIDNKEMYSLDPNSIENITVLKDVAGTALYGSPAVNGVIIIETKQSKVRKFIIKDFLDGDRIPGATVSFISADKKDTIMMAANDSGVVATDKLKNWEEYKMTVSAIGHKTFSSDFKNNYGYKEKEVLLERNIGNCYEVVVDSGGTRRIACGISKAYYMETKKVLTINKENVSSFKVYPNPAVAGSTITIEWNKAEAGDYDLHLFNQSGQLQMRQEISYDEDRRFAKINLPAAISAGTYFLRVTDRKKGKSYTEKIIVE